MQVDKLLLFLKQLNATNLNDNKNNCCINMRYYVIYLDGFYSKANDIFLENNFNNSYSIEIHSRTNAIGMPIKPNYAILQSNIKDFFINGEFQKNDIHNMDVDYTPTSWRKLRISINGEILKYIILKTQNVFYVITSTIRYKL